MRETISRTQTAPLIGAAVLALSPASGLSASWGGRSQVECEIFGEQPENQGFSACSLQLQTEADTGVKALSFDHMLTLTKDFLAHRGLNPKYVNRTANGGALLQFAIPNEPWLDLYPTGEMVVVVRDGNQNHVHEVTSGDLSRIAGLLTNGGIAA